MNTSSRRTASSSADAPRYSPAAMGRWLATAFEACGLDADSARSGADVLVRTSTRGIDTHGVSRVLVYVKKLQAGDMNPRPAVQYAETGGVLHCHADGGLGQAVASAAVAKAVSLARQRGFVPVLLREVGHLAALGMYALQAAEAGMLCLIVQATPPLMSLPGSRGAAIGNNPLAFGSPVRDRVPMVFDMAASGVARGSVLAAARDGRPIPSGWAIDSDGNPTTDAARALAGAMLPMAGHKGIGLAMMVECLAGSLTGAAPAAVVGAVPGSAPSRVGAFLFVADPDLIVGRDAYDTHMAVWLRNYSEASGPGGRYPGEGASAVEAERLVQGIPLSAGVIAELREVGVLTGTPFSIDPMTR